MNCDNCVRLYNKDGVHLLSILLCSDDCYDICLPSGKVLYCGVDVGVVEVLSEHLGLELIKKD